MEVYALSGPSGTGKSDSALLFAYNNHISTIIDDGLLIYKGKKLAGISAKYEKNSYTATKRAIFYYEDHTEEVKKVLETLPTAKILIIGTSEKMVNIIAKKLKLGNIDHYIDVKSIRSSNEIKMALFVRKTQGKHVIPIPYAQIEQSFFKKLIFKGTKVFSLQKEIIGETTIVSPNFQKDSTIIYPEVLKKIVASACESIPQVDGKHHIIVVLGNLPNVKLELNIKTSKSKSLIDIIKQIQDKINEDFQQYLSIRLYSIDIHVLKLTYNS